MRKWYSKCFSASFTMLDFLQSTGYFDSTEKKSDRQNTCAILYKNKVPFYHGNK